MVRRKEGSITVFLTLAGMLIFAMMATMVETARFGVCANHAARTLRTSTEALLTEYSRPLYENYGLFFLEQAGTPYEKVIARYAGDTMEASKGGKMDLLRGTFREISVTERICAGDNGARALAEEITAYMERKMVKNQLKKFMKKTDDMRGTEEQAQDIEKTVEEQEKLAELDMLVLKLMELVDGIAVSGGRIRCKTYFVKMFSQKEKPKAKDLGVTEASVFREMKKKLDTAPAHWEHISVSAFLPKVKKAVEVAEQAVAAGEELEQKYQGIHRHTGNSALIDDTGKDGENALVEHLVGQLPVLKGNLRVLEETVSLLEKETDAETVGKLKILWKDYDTKSIVFNYTGINERGGADNPLDTLSGMWGNGILNLVCEKPDALSKKSVSAPDGYASLYGIEKKAGEDYGERVRELAEDEKVHLSGVLDGSASYAWSEFCVNSYITDKLSGYMEKSGRKDWKHRLSYQREYIIGGKKSDKANLEAVLNRILLIRTAVNFSAIYRDVGKKGEAYAAAAAIVGFTGMEPLIRLTQTLIIVAWSMVESLVDIAGLLQEREVPFIKNPGQVLTSFADLFMLSGNAITKRAKKFPKAGKKSFGYSDYIKFFLFSVGSEKRRFRIMDIIQWDMQKNGYQSFQIGTCVCSLTVQGTAYFPARLFCFAPVGKLLGRDMRQYQSVSEIRVSYI